jgi:hypothetical protein
VCVCVCVFFFNSAKFVVGEGRGAAGEGDF